MNSVSLVALFRQISNNFWVEVLQAYAKVSTGITIDVEEMNRYGLWYSDTTKHKSTCIKAWQERGVRYLSDIIAEDGHLLSFQQIKEMYQLRGSYLDYTGIIRSLPSEWKALPRKIRSSYPIIHPQVEYVLSKEKGAKYLHLQCHIKL